MIRGWLVWLLLLLGLGSLPRVVSEAESYYDTLGITKDATITQIKKAFRRLALKHHPDRSKEPDADAKFRKIAEAYEVLGNEQTRKDYDKFGPGSTSGHTFDYDAFMHNFRESMKEHRRAHEEAHRAAHGGEGTLFDDLWDGFDDMFSFDDLEQIHDGEDPIQIDPSTKYQQFNQGAQKCRQITKKSGNSVTTHTVCSNA